MVESNVHRVLDDTGSVLAILMPDMRSLSHAEFVTEDSDEMQVGSFKYDSKHKVRKHIHNELPRTISRTQEFLYVQDGTAKVSIYDMMGVLVEVLMLTQRSGLLIFKGWHDVEVDDHCHFFEVKLGPYMGLNDKSYED